MSFCPGALGHVYLTSVHCRTLPKSYMQKVVENIRTYNIQALLVIGGFEVWATAGNEVGARTLENVFSAWGRWGGPSGNPMLLAGESHESAD